MKKFRVLLTVLCFSLAAVLTLGLVMFLSPVETNAEGVTYDEVKVYDYLEITGEESYTVSGTATAKQLGTVTETNNYAVRLKVSGWSAAPAHVILHIGGSDGWGNGGYVFHSEWEYGIYKDRGNTELKKTTGSAAYNDFNGIGEVTIEFGVKKAYEDGAYVGNYVYCKVNDVEKISVLDETGTEALSGTGVYIPDSTLGINLQHMMGLTLSTTRTYDEVKVYDYLELTGEESYMVSGTATAKQLGTVTETNNYAVRLKVSGWSAAPAHVILHIGGSDGWGNGGYIFHSEWEYGIYKDRGSTELKKTTGSAAYNDFNGIGEVTIEFGVKKTYEDGVYVGNYVYCKVNDVEKISVLDETGTEEMAGTGVYIPDSALGINLQHMMRLTLSTAPTVIYKNGDVIIAEKFFSGEAITAPAAPEAAEGKVFVGWESEGKLYPDGYTLTSVTGRVIFSAVYVDFGMTDGASVRIDEPTGIRFRAEFLQADYEALVALAGADNVELGMRVVRGGTAYVDIVADNKVVEVLNEEEYVIFNGVIVNILEENYKTSYCGTGYADITFADGSTKRIYAVAGDNTRTIAEVAKAAYDADNSLEQLKKYFE